MALSFFLINKNFKKNLLNVIFFVLVILCIDSIIQYSVGYNILGYKAHASRISSFFKDELVLGSFLLKMYPFFLISLIYFQRYKKFNKKEIFSIFCISIYFFAVFISGERTSFFNFVLMNLILIIIFFKKIFLRYIILIPIIFFFFVSISYIQNKNTIERYLDVRNILTNKSIVFFSATHEKHYKSAYKIF